MKIVSHRTVKTLHLFGRTAGGWRGSGGTFSATNGLIALQTMRVLAFPSRETTASKSGADSEPDPLQMEKLEEAGKLANSLKFERPYSVPGILFGTSAFTANGWEGSFYPRGMQPHDFLSYYATQFATVEVDSTFYGCPSARTVNNWAARIPQDFIFSAKGHHA